ncbi:MAG: endo-1,4-beta-xylanase [Defluviitaleaceae bacterium]|nr:endo-1,4-beta-xylanase [Defluviitaleaceae bacterium]
MEWIKVRIDGSGGVAQDEAVLKTLYASDMEFEPDERRLRILPDGIAELAVTRKPYMLHVKLKIPMYGVIWVMAHNFGQGYTGDFVDFVTEAIRTYIYEAKERSKDIVLSVAAQAHLDAAVEYEHIANRGTDTGENRLYALSHAIYAAEAALFESSMAKAYANPRADLRMGCNFFKYTSPGARYAKYFSQVFDFASLPFYAGRTVPEKGRYTYEYIDNALSFLESANITPKGHPLWFGHAGVNPQWLYNQTFEDLKKSAKEIATHHVSAYKGRVDIWDSMNEAHDWANCFELNQSQLIELTRVCCSALREANGNATSIVNICLPFAEYVAGRYNCYGALPERLMSSRAYIATLVEKDIDFDVVGIQLYFPARDMVAVDRMLDVFKAFGKPVHITEMGVNGGTRGKGAGTSSSSTWAYQQLSMSEGLWHNGWNEVTQADWMEQFYTLCAAREEIKALTWWDFIEPSFSGNGAFLYEDEMPREIFFRLGALKKRLVQK